MELDLITMFQALSAGGDVATAGIAYMLFRLDRRVLALEISRHAVEHYQCALNSCARKDEK